jgi:hypothetical protein
MSEVPFSHPAVKHKPEGEGLLALPVLSFRSHSAPGYLRNRRLSQVVLITVPDALWAHQVLPRRWHWYRPRAESYSLRVLKLARNAKFALE